MAATLDATGSIELLVDGTCLSSEPKGVGIYVHRVLEQLAELHPRFKMTVLMQRRAWDVRELVPENANIDFVSWRNHLWHGLVVIPRLASKLGADIVLVPYETPIGPLRLPFAMVCHAIPPLMYEAQREGGQRRNPATAVVRFVDGLLLPNTLRRAARVFANSEWVAQELASRYRIRQSRLSLAPCAPAHDFEALGRTIDVGEVRSGLDSPKGYILVIYTGDPLENFAVVPEVFDRVVAKGLPHNLVIVGVHENERREVESLLRSYSWMNRARIIPFIPVEEHERLAGLYAGASLYFDPSLQEGFGMQVVEAMASGAPVVCTSRGALSEVAGEAAVLVDPTDIESMAAGVISLLADDASAQKYRQRACVRSRRFSWRMSAMQIGDALLGATQT
jgi:glycosyltransferase involved in cell wall biosynthesis